MNPRELAGLTSDADMATTLSCPFAKPIAMGLELRAFL